MKHGHNWEYLKHRFGGFRTLRYAGVGSRDTPPDICFLQHLIGFRMASIGVSLASGDALGSDRAFYSGCREWCLKQSEVPAEAAYVYVCKRDLWKAEKFCSPNHIHVFEDSANYEKALAIASTIHPNWEACVRKGVHNLHGRNCYQILTDTLCDPINQMVFWAPPQGKSVKGGTRTAFELAESRSIETLNLYYPEVRQRAFAFLGITETYFQSITPKQS